MTQDAAELDSNVTSARSGDDKSLPENGFKMELNEKTEASQSDSQPDLTNTGRPLQQAGQNSATANPNSNFSSRLSAETALGSAPSQPSSPRRSSVTVPAPERERNRRRRSTMDFRGGPRISEMFSNLLHRRQDVEGLPDVPAEEVNQPDEVSAKRSSREIIVTPTINVPKPESPPPPLPPPSLSELGLSMSVLTGNLAPPHFSTPPTSGTFLAPHYLLLCHPQGLDALSLVTPPAPEPFAIVRRVNFKSVVVMEERGVLIAIAGRREGVRVYALDELRRVIEWRVELEVKKERDRLRKEGVKKLTGMVDQVFSSSAKSEPSSPLRTSITSSGNPPSPKTPRQPTIYLAKPKPKTPETSRRSLDSPPAYTLVTTPSTSHRTLHPHSPGRNLTVIAPDRRSRSGSTATVTMSPPGRHNLLQQTGTDPDMKGDWVEGGGSSDEEPLSLATAGASGSAALDERTSTIAAQSGSAASGLNVTISNSQHPSQLRDITSQSVAVITPTVEAGGRTGLLARGSGVNAVSALNDRTPSNGRSPMNISPRSETANLDNDRAQAQEVTDGDMDANEEEYDAGSPTGEVSLAQILMESRLPDLPPPGSTIQQQPRMLLGSPTLTPQREESDNDDSSRPAASRSISLAQMLMESRLPDLPPPGSRIQQEAILLTSPSGQQPSESNENREAAPSPQGSRARRRWSFLAPSPSDIPPRRPSSARPQTGVAEPRSPSDSLSSIPQRGPLTRSRSSSRLLQRTSNSRQASAQQASDSDTVPPLSAPANGMHRSSSPAPPLPSSGSSRFLPRIFSGNLGSRRPEESSRKGRRNYDADGVFSIGAPPQPHPKLDYVKLPGTKGSVLIKAVETARKSFLAILCGDNGEKVELFAGTYRTALSLSRTFILPDSPRSLELQVQGDDLVEIYLVFSQNVFGLEPATVRVREVRIGRAERRAARRRAREARTPGTDTPAALDEDTNVSVNIGVDGHSDALAVDEAPNEGNTGDEPDPQPVQPSVTISDPAELLAIAAAQSAPYTTFQQLSFSPAFPLAVLGDDVIIPPSYPSFLRHREQHESTNNENIVELPVQQFTPPGLPPPRNVPQSRWLYRDPKGVIQGPWKSSLMHSWFKDGLLPVDLPVRRESDSEFITLKDLRAQSVDPEHPFRNHVPVIPDASPSVQPAPMEAKPLLPPVSILEQPRHFGPPALFFSSRGGHSTTVVDAKGRSVLRGRFMWSPDDGSDGDVPLLSVKLGDIKRVEAFDVRDRAVIVAFRQGGLEAVDVGDALYRPADESRSYIPLYQAPLSGFNRRQSYVWRNGGPLAVPPSASPVASWNSRVPAVRKTTSGMLRAGKSSDVPAAGEDTEWNTQEEVMFLGRRDDNIYICERNALSFRILRLAPS